MKKTILLFFLVLLPILSFSQEGFEYATTSQDDIDYYIKIESDVDNNMGLYTDFWLKYENPINKIKTNTGKYKTVGGGYTLIQMYVSCTSKTQKIKYTIKYNKSGNVIGRDDTPSFDQPIIPGSVMESIYKKVCKKD